MSYGATELDPGTGGDTVARDSITTLNGQVASPAGAIAQLVKPVFGGEGSATMVDADHPFPMSDKAAQELMSQVLRLLGAPLGFDPNLGRVKVSVAIESGNTLATITTVGTVTTVTTVTTVGTVTNLAQIDSMQGRTLVFGEDIAHRNSFMSSRITA